MRHADAGRAHSSAASDQRRWLTPAGRRKARARGRELKRRIAGFDAILTSPLPRAAETAAIVAGAYGCAPAPLPALAPGRRQAEILRHLRRWHRAGARAVLLVGHEPDLSRLACWLLARRRRAFLALTKGGCCALSVHAHAAGADLAWWWD